MESAIGEQYQLLADNPSAKVVQCDYQRGLFSVTETVTFELFGEMAQAMATENPGAKAPEAFKPIRITVRSDIRHGSLPGFSTLAAVVVDSELVLDGELQKQVSAVIGNQKPLQVHTQYRFDGGGLSTLKSPAFSTHWAADQGVGQNSLAWDGIKMSVDFEKGMIFRSMAISSMLRASLVPSRCWSKSRTTPRRTTTCRCVTCMRARRCRSVPCSKLYSDPALQLAARVKCRDFKDEDLGNPLLLAKLDVSAEVPLPEAMLGTLAGHAPATQEKGEEEISAEEAAAARNEKLRQQLVVFIEQGLVQSEGTLIQSKLAFSNGQMTINGKPFNPMAMGAPAKPM